MIIQYTKAIIKKIISLMQALHFGKQQKNTIVSGVKNHFGADAPVVLSALRVLLESSYAAKHKYNSLKNTIDTEHYGTVELEILFYSVKKSEGLVEGVYEIKITDGNGELLSYRN